jgi:hypothetical protein
MAHRRVGPRLIPAFPNEISDLILYELSSHELTIGFFVSLAWQDFLDGDAGICKRMFRLPKRLRSADKAAREQFVDDLWANTYPKVKNNEFASAIWKHIEFNPPYDEDLGAAVYDGRYEVVTSDHFLYTDNEWLTPHLRSKLSDLRSSIFVTYPPITRVQYRHRVGRSIIPRSETEMLYDKAGITMGYLSTRTVFSRLACNHHTLTFWPDRMYLDSWA